ncbi:transposase [Spongiactinospora sp. 9N601]|uniref:transposase n=1 Tax=Spongiactinospora sp. 9N601 TaxID=3375149 RepID=UPI00379FC875
MSQHRCAYPTDLTDSEWALLEPLIPAPKSGGRPILQSRTGCAWRLLPHDLPPWQTVYHYWRARRDEGRWEQVLAVRA